MHDVLKIRRVHIQIYISDFFQKKVGISGNMQCTSWCGNKLLTGDYFLD